MNIPLRALVISLAIAATLAGCNRDKPADSPTAAVASAPIPPAEAAAPMAYDSKTPYAEVSLALPIAIKSQPELHAALYARTVADLRSFVEGAQADRTEAGGDPGMAPYNKSIAVTPGAETGRLFSLIRTDSEYTGGAHPNASFRSILWDKGFKREITTADLFVKAANLATLDNALCAAINAEKKKRDPTAQTVALSGATWTCPRAATTPFALAQATTPGKAGGLVFQIAPYQVGPYSDGAFQVTVPQSAFRGLIAPAYADEFGGEPKPAAA